MAKPRLQYQRGMWYCHIRSLYATPIGVGNTPQSAYSDWQHKTNHPDIAKAERLRILEILRKADNERNN